MPNNKSIGKEILFSYVARTFLIRVDEEVLHQFASDFEDIEDVREKHVGRMCNSLGELRNRAAHANPDATITIGRGELMATSNELVDYLCERARGMLANKRMYDDA